MTLYTPQLENPVRLETQVVTAWSLFVLRWGVTLTGMNALFVLRAIVFVIVSILACVLLPFLLVQYPLVGIVLIAIGIWLFSRSFARRKRFQ